MNTYKLTIRNLALLTGICSLLVGLLTPIKARADGTAIYHFSPGTWGGGIDDEFGRSVIIFEANRSQLTRLRIGNFVTNCVGPKTKAYPWPVTLSNRQTDPFPFLIHPDGRFDGGFEVDQNDFAYGGVQVTLQGRLQGTSGVAYIGLTSFQPDGVECRGAGRFSVIKMSQANPGSSNQSPPGFPRVPGTGGQGSAR